MTPNARCYLDADLSPRIAEIARALGLDVISAHEVGMIAAEDGDQLARAAAEGRVLVTRNRDDFLQLTLEAYHDNGPHAGLLLVANVPSQRQASRIAHALLGWAKDRGRVAAYSVHWLQVG